MSREPLWSTPFTWAEPWFTGLALRFRHPLADLRLLDFVARIPPEPWLMRKWILREATRDLLPEAVRTRQKAPLVRGPRASITLEALERLVQLACTLPDVERFFDPHSLVDAIMAPAAAIDHGHDHPLMRALGLVHWRAHWRRPTFSGLGSEGVRVMSSIEEEGNDERSRGAGQVGFA